MILEFIYIALMILLSELGGFEAVVVTLLSMLVWELLIDKGENK